MEKKLVRLVNDKKLGGVRRAFSGFISGHLCRVRSPNRPGFCNQFRRMRITLRRGDNFCLSPHRDQADGGKKRQAGSAPRVIGVNVIILYNDPVKRSFPILLRLNGPIEFLVNQQTRYGRQVIRKLFSVGIGVLPVLDVVAVLDIPEILPVPHDGTDL